jgi:predicted metal-binding protein
VKKTTGGLEKYVELALAAGVSEAKIIPVSNVVTAEWVRLKCQFGCDGYGNGLCCPPRTPRQNGQLRMRDHK